MSTVLNIRLNKQSEKALESIMERCGFESKSEAVRKSIEMLGIVNEAYKEGYEVLSIPKEVVEKLGIPVAILVKPIYSK